MNHDGFFKNIINKFKVVEFIKVNFNKNGDRIKFIIYNLLIDILKYRWWTIGSWIIKPIVVQVAIN
jgi:hypothetical protein